MGHGGSDQRVSDERLREIYAGVMASRGAKNRAVDVHITIGLGD